MRPKYKNGKKRIQGKQIPIINIPREIREYIRSMKQKEDFIKSKNSKNKDGFLETKVIITKIIKLN